MHFGHVQAVARRSLRASSVLTRVTRRNHLVLAAREATLVDLHGATSVHVLICWRRSLISHRDQLSRLTHSAVEVSTQVKATSLLLARRLAASLRSAVIGNLLGATTTYV